ncbi:MAG: type IV toxin-antitoxin system AbiEi family antitoxin domain-containing protein [Christensenellales bacterium]
MGTEEALSALLKENYGYFTTGQASAFGLDRWALSRLVQDGRVLRVTQGLYAKADILPDRLIVAQHRCSLGVFSHETALCLHDMSDRFPLQLMMTIPSGWNSSALKDPGMVFFYSRKAWFDIGLSKVDTLAGPPVRCYDAERTLCDCVRAMDRLDRDLVVGALKTYMRQPNPNKAKLLNYALIFGIRDTVYQYMEVLS